jgi:hypothetical protein
VKTEFNLNVFERFSSYGAVNTLRLYYKKNLLIRCREIILLWFENHTKHINTLRGQNVGFLTVNPGVHKVTTGLEVDKIIIIIIIIIIMAS